MKMDKAASHELTDAHESVRRHRWIKRVERTVDQLSILIDNKPRLGKRRPNLPSDFESRVRELLVDGRQPSTIGVIKGGSRSTPSKKDFSQFVLALNESHKAALSEFEFKGHEKNQPTKWSKWTLDRSLGYYFKTRHRSHILHLELYVKKDKEDQARHYVGRFEMDLRKLEKRKLVRKRSIGGTDIYDLRIILQKEHRDIVSEMVSLPDYFDPGIKALASDWKDDPSRPVVSSSVIVWYEKQLKKWIADSGLPMLIRKHRGNRGHIRTHKSGRILIPCDNAPANWFFSSALFDHSFDAKEVPEKLINSTLPIGMVADTGATYKGHQSIKMDPPNLNTLNFKICHVEPVGIGYGEIEDINLKVLKEHMYRFLSVKNMFLLPKQYGALGELDAFVEVFRDG